MNPHQADLYPMRVNPLNFNKGDVVKKIITDAIQTPYVGIVTALIPSTNKVEVQWPQGMGMEDPWDLIKVNPIINPPVVNEDKSYKTYQNELSKKYFEKIKPHSVLNDYVEEEMKPLLLHVSSLYNRGLSKEDSFKKMYSSYNTGLLIDALDRVYNNHVDIKKSYDISVDDHVKKASISLIGSDFDSFCVVLKMGDDVTENHFNNYKNALDFFNKNGEILNSLNKPFLNVEDIVKKVAKNRSENNQ